MVELVQPFVPVMCQDRFSDLTGLSEATVRGMIEKGHLPTLKIGKRRMINVAALTKGAIDSEN